MSTAAADRASLLARVRAIWTRRELLEAMTLREVQVRYKQAFLGMAWAVFLPLSLMLVTAALRKGLSVPADPGVPGAVWAFCGSLPWTFHQTALKGCTGTLVTNKNLLQKVYFPRELFPLAKIGAALVDFAVGLVVLAVLMLAYGVTPTASALLLPAVVLVHFLFVAGLGMILCAANVFFRDVQYVLDVLILVWMLFSPVVVDLRGRYVVGGLDVVADLNPMHPILTGYRDVLLHGGIVDVSHFLVGVAWAVATFVLGFLFFARCEPLLAERA